MKRFIALVSAASLAVLALAAVGGSAHANVSGFNGEIVFSRDDPNLGDTVSYVVNPDGGQLHQLAPIPAPGTSENPRWSPDGSELAVLSGPCCPATNAAVIVNPDRGTDRVLTMPSSAVQTFCWVWSPDAKRLACEGFSDTDPSRNGIYTIRTSDGRGLRRVTSNPGGDDVPIDYSPNGARIVFGRDPYGFRSRRNTQALFVVNLRTGKVHRITPWGWSDDDGSWSPDGSKIVFEHFGSLFTVHSDGSGLSKIMLQTRSSTTAFTAFDAAWSPDGTKLVFSLVLQGPAGSLIEGIGTANADGSNVQMITTSPTRDGKADWGTHPPAS